MLTTTSITVSPLQAVVGGFCIGAGAYVGYQATKALHDVCSDAVEAAKKKLKEKETETKK